MNNVFFPEEQVTENDLYFICYMIERISRKLHQHNRYVVNHIGKEELEHALSMANVLHSENPLKIESEWIAEYQLKEGNFDILKVNPDLDVHIPSETQMGKVYTRLIVDTMLPEENYAEAILRVYNNSICEVIDNYNASAFYEPSYVIARAYNEGGF